jgi:hypothetical protein
MLTQPFDNTGGLLAQVQEGMTVFDRDQHKVGTVKECYLGGEDLSEATVAPDSALGGVPPALRSRLAAHGFLEISTGLLAANRYASGTEVAAVDAAGVHLSVSQDELPKK